MRSRPPRSPRISIGWTLAALLATGSAPAWAQLSTGTPATNFNMVTYPTGFSVGTTPTDVAPLADGRLVVTLKGGQINVVTAAGQVVTRTGNRLTVDSTSEKGLLGVVADPGFATNHVLYFYASEGPSNADKHHVRKATLSDANDLTFDPTLVVGGNLEGPANHDGGGMFIHKNQLYIGVGDTGFNRTPPNNQYSSCLNKPNGKILRVNLDGSIPTDNPLSNVAMVTACNTETQGSFDMQPPEKRIYAWGFRNPWRLWIDPMTDLMWIGDVGETTREEISVGPGGRHYGYPFHEGTMNYTTVFPNMDCNMNFTPSTMCVPPAYDYPNMGQAGNNCVIGGLILDTCGWVPGFGGQTRYIFGDHGTGMIWTLQVTADRRGVVANSRADFADLPSGLSSFRMAPDGSLFVVADGGNTLYKVTPKDRSACPAGGTGGAGGGGAGGAVGSGGAGGTTDAGSADARVDRGPDAVADARDGTGTGGAGGAGSGGAGAGGAGGGGGGGAGGAVASGTGGTNATTGAGGAGGGGAGTGGARADGGTTPKPATSGCGCAVASAPASALAATAPWLLLGAAMIRARRRRRDR